MTVPATPASKPTLFLSYASEDRAAARQLRDALTTAGLDVWYDENELGGGDAWDQKIRRQIRACDYFMPVISVNTERRKEGYFRREWRLAVERTLDMADDVMFLLPVAIDGTGESGARVPEKFLAVQWMHAPGGAVTPALQALAGRLAAGEHLAPLPARGRSAPPISRAPAASEPPPLTSAHDGPPPMPPLPQMHGQGGTAVVKYLAELAWWVVTGIWLIVRRLPRWVRGLLLLWVLFSFLGFCSRSGSKNERTSPRPTTKETNAATPAKVQVNLESATKALSESGLPESWKQLGAEAAKRLAAELKNPAASNKQIVAMPFASGIEDPTEAKLLTEVFTIVWGRLALERPDRTGLVSTPMPAPSDAELVAIGRNLSARYVLGARMNPAAGGSAANELTVTLFATEDGSIAWKNTFPTNGADAAAIAHQIANAVLQVTASP